MLPALATLDDLSVRLTDELNEADLERAQAALDDASSRIRGEVRQSFVDGDGELALPDGWRGDALTRVCLAAALRALQNPQGYDDQANNAAPDVYLTSQERRDVRRAAQVSNIGAIPTTRGPIETRGVCDPAAANYVDVDPAGKALPVPLPDPWA